MIELPPHKIHLWLFKESDRKTSNIQTRKLLSQYIDMPPEGFEFIKGEHGKPALKDSPVHFNLSHSGEYSLFAFSRAEVGVDIECVRQNVRHLEIATRLFSKNNQTLLRSLTGKVREDFFYKLWNFHEAYLKALGQSVFFAPRIAKRIEFDKPDLTVIQGSNFVVHNLEAPQGYSAAVSALDPKAQFEFKN